MSKTICHYIMSVNWSKLSLLNQMIYSSRFPPLLNQETQFLVFYYQYSRCAWIHNRLYHQTPFPRSVMFSSSGIEWTDGENEYITQLVLHCYITYNNWINVLPLAIFFITTCCIPPIACLPFKHSIMMPAFQRSWIHCSLILLTFSKSQSSILKNSEIWPRPNEADMPRQDGIKTAMGNLMWFSIISFASLLSIQKA